jgi:RNA polymerase-binding transcription factor DksA
METDAMSDEADLAQIEEQVALSNALRKASLQPTTAARFDAHDNKLCLTCGEPIPAARAALTFAVRCIPCQVAYEADRGY